VHRISLTGGANQPPSAVAAASPSSGPAPLVVSFSSAGSADPDGDPLTYDWDFGDQSAHSDSAAPAHTYAAGTFTATLRVSDDHGNSATATLRIDSGNTAPAPAISAPPASLRYRVGQSITLQGGATDIEEGALPGSSLTWQVLLHHNAHTHPLIPPTAGSALTLTAPPPEDLAATGTSYLEVFLSATDSHGLTSVITRELRPHLGRVRARRGRAEPGRRDRPRVPVRGLVGRRRSGARDHDARLDRDLHRAVWRRAAVCSTGYEVASEHTNAALSL
jgi:PKD repeat protein